MAKDTFLTGVERTFSDDEMIITRTDTAGRITYCNRTFMSIAGYQESELIGVQHSIIRHPAMPRCAFKLVWDVISSGKEIFAYVLNRASNGDHYWVFAHISPTFDDNGKIVGYNSARRNPSRAAIAKIEPIYKALLAEEKKYPNAKDGMMAGYNMLINLLATNGVSYDEFVFSL
jgi:PAS domain S-box-containing protein